MMVRDNTLHLLRPLGVAINLVATMIVAWCSYWFGQQLGGPFIGVVAAVNAAAMSSLLISGLLDWLARAAQR